MKVIRGIPQLPSSVRTAIAIGNFDGIHLGHQALLRSVAERAREAGETPCVLTFEPHPKEFFRPEAAPARILTLRDKASAIASCGIEALFIAPFNRDLAGMPAESFVRDILKGRLRASFVAVGTNFTFGAGPADSAELVRLGAKHGIRICAEKLVEENDACVSSTRLREVLSRGDLEEAERPLGRPYCLSGRVLHGAETGRTIGFPTLNLRPLPPGSGAKPALEGVFAVMVSGLVPGKEIPGVASIGNRPTIAGGLRYTCETNLLDWTGNAYGRMIRVRFVKKLRGNRKFSGLPELMRAIRADAAAARRLFGLPESPSGKP